MHDRKIITNTKDVSRNSETIHFVILVFTVYKCINQRSFLFIFP